MKIACLVLLVSFLTACTSVGSGRVSVIFEGDTRADETLKSDVLSNALLLTSANGCSSIERVATSILSPPSGEPGREKFEEKWILFGCGQSFPFGVTLTGDGSGGTFLGVERKF